MGPLGLYQCHPYLAMSQFFSLSRKGELRKESFCAEAFDNLSVKLTECHMHSREQFWVLFRNGTIYNPSFQKCLSSRGAGSSKGMVLHSCRDTAHQRWKFTYVNESLVTV